ncbi:MaoC family dehydratase [Haliea sp. E1-2-M8]|uniref:MaoC family dehydratase n=1 Tax=Haliea sp. E1-2-M8 TaxID=3064706 RepID=UPI00351C9003
MWRFNSFEAGQLIQLGKYQLTAEDIIEFATRYDPQPMHTDPVAAAHSPMGELIASGWHTCAIAMRLLCDAFISDSSSVAAPGVDSIRWLAPVRPGDILSGQCRILETRLSQSKPDRGVVTAEVSLQRQDAVEVLRMKTTALYLV